MKRGLTTGITIMAAIHLWAQAPAMFRYQGRLVNGTNLVNAAVPMSFSLYNAQSGGTRLYEDSGSVTVVDGLYSTYIGDNTTFGSLTDAMTNAAVYLELTVNSEKLSPRERLVSVPYALAAGGDKTPSGTVVLSAAYPNLELEAQGYSLVYDNLEADDWKEIGNAYLPDFGSMPKFFTHSNQLWSCNAMTPTDNLKITSDGKQWRTGTIPLPNLSIAKGISHKESVYFFSTMSQKHVGCSTTDGQTWTVWTNNIDATVYLDDFASFKGALWAFGRSVPGTTSLVFTSQDGANWTEASTGLWSDVSEVAGGTILSSKNAIWVIAMSAPPLMGKMVWHSADGINWTQSVTNLPADSMSINKTLVFENKLWHFSFGNKTCWNSGNNGDIWSLVTTNLPTTGMSMNDNVIVHENKLWMSALKNMGPTTRPLAVSGSTNGTDWTQTLAASAVMGIFLAGSEDGRLWACSYGAMNPALYIIGGPKKQDGLYYYRKE